jgi:C-5 cytosine-specific DNA methylase
MKTALILFEYSGVFTNILKKMGYNAIQVDTELGIDIHKFDYKKYKNVEIVLAFPPCTEFAVSGARWFADKDKNSPNLLKQAVANVRKVLEIVNYHKPKVWFIENPVGRIERCVPQLRRHQKYIFDPYQFAGYAPKPKDEAYTKKTCLWGRFNVPIEKSVAPILGTEKMLNPTDKDGKKLGWNTDAIKKARNLSPKGFARAFVAANCQVQRGLGENINRTKQQNRLMKKS